MSNVAKRGRNLIVIVVAIFILCYVFNGLGSMMRNFSDPEITKTSSSEKSVAKKSVSEKPTESKDPKVLKKQKSLTRYYDIEIGMTIQEVYAIKGEPCEVDSTQSGSGKRDVWKYKKNDDWESYTFDDGKLDHKSIY